MVMVYFIPFYQGYGEKDGHGSGISGMMKNRFLPKIGAVNWI
jgi:hypothetical protein